MEFGIGTGCETYSDFENRDQAQKLTVEYGIFKSRSDFKTKI